MEAIERDERISGYLAGKARYNISRAYGECTTRSSLLTPSKILNFQGISFFQSRFLICWSVDQQQLDVLSRQRGELQKKMNDFEAEKKSLTNEDRRIKDAFQKLKEEKVCFRCN
jgi:hypothetical protein